MFDARSARTTDSCNIAIVGVDAHDISGNAVCFKPGDDDVSWTTILGAVTAGSEDLPNIDNGIVLDRCKPTAIGLYDFVFGLKIC